MVAVSLSPAMNGKVRRRANIERQTTRTES